MTRNQWNGTRLRAWRRSKGWTLQELARKLKVNWVTVQRWETNHQAPREIAQYLLAQAGFSYTAAPHGEK